VDWAFCEREGIDVVRRPTGGGGIYHDTHADIAYSIVAPADELPGDLMDTYERLCEPLFSGFDRLGVSASFADAERPALFEPACYLRALHPAHDVVVGGRKISGNAQYRRRDSVIQHGSIMFDDSADRHLATFADPPVVAERFRERVTAIGEHTDVDRETAVEAFEASLAEWADAATGEWTDAELDRARERARTKYDAAGWNRDREDPTV
jgi:lipoate-protein ligase A